jgi:TrmH family RNA methyltransferase
MLSNKQKGLIRKLHKKKGRRDNNMTLVEDTKLIEAAGDLVEFTFTRSDAENYDQLLTTRSPQDVAGVARLPSWNKTDVEKSKTILVLDGVQIPGNVGTMLRLCLGFDATLISVESVDVSNPKVVRSSAGALFHVPTLEMNRSQAESYLKTLNRDIYRLEAGGEPASEDIVKTDKPSVIVAGSEAHGIKLSNNGSSLTIGHNPKLESLNVSHAAAIVMHQRYNHLQSL